MNELIVGLIIVCSSGSNCDIAKVQGVDAKECGEEVEKNNPPNDISIFDVCELDPQPAWAICRDLETD